MVPPSDGKTLGKCRLRVKIIPSGVDKVVALPEAVWTWTRKR